MARDVINFYRHWLNPIDSLDDKEKIEYLNGIFSYAFDDVKVESSRVVKVLLESVYKDVERQRQISEIRSRCGSMGGGQKGNKNAEKTSKTSKFKQNEQNEQNQDLLVSQERVDKKEEKKESNTKKIKEEINYPKENFSCNNIIVGIPENEQKKTETKKTIEQRKCDFKVKVFKFEWKYEKSMLDDFYDYWTEIGDGCSKMRFEKQDSFEVGKRLARWYKNNQERNYGQRSNYSANRRGIGATDESVRKLVAEKLMRAGVKFTE